MTLGFQVISGSNAGLTDSQGNTTFICTSTPAATDMLQASLANASGGVPATTGALR